MSEIIDPRERRGEAAFSRQLCDGFTDPNWYRLILFTLQHSVFRESSSSLLPKGEGLNVPNFKVR